MWIDARLQISLGISVLLLMAGSCGSMKSSNASSETPTASTPQARHATEIVIPDPPTAKPVFYEVIDKWTAENKEKRLRDTPLNEKDIEVRVWAGFGLIPSSAFLLKRTNGTWSAHKMRTVRPIDDEDSAVLLEPAQGWEAAWQSLLAHQLLTLPDGTKIKCNANYEDGYSYVVELRQGRNYRTYSYDNPWGKFKNRCKEADEILAIASIIMNDYRATGFRVDD